MVHYHRVQLLLGSLVNFDRKSDYGPEHFAHKICDDQEQNGNQNQERHQGTQRTVARDFISNTSFLCHNYPVAVVHCFN